MFRYTIVPQNWQDREAWRDFAPAFAAVMEKYRDDWDPYRQISITKAELDERWQLSESQVKLLEKYLKANLLPAVCKWPMCPGTWRLKIRFCSRRRKNNLKFLLPGLRPRHLRVRDKFDRDYLSQDDIIVIIMPTIVIKGYKFRFYSSDRFEPPHVHVIKAENVAKVWLQPVSLQYNRRYNPAELNRILRLTRQHKEELLEFWYDYFSK